MEFINEAVLHAAGQWWIYPLLLVFFFVDGFAMVVPSETLIVALAAYSVHSGQPADPPYIEQTRAWFNAMWDNISYEFPA